MATLSYMVLDSLPVVFTSAKAKKNGASDRDLLTWRKDGRTERIARGIHVKRGIEADFDLVEITIRAPQGVLCLTTALALHGLIDDIPPTTNVALPRRFRQPKTTAPVTWHRFDEQTFHIGQQKLPIIDNLTLNIYNPARSIIDAFRLNHLYGEEQANQALKRWLNQNGQPSELLNTAASFPSIGDALSNSLRILL